MHANIAHPYIYSKQKGINLQLEKYHLKSITSPKNENTLFPPKAIPCSSPLK